MKIVSFTDGQSGKEWLDWRKNGIGASDVPVLMGSNKWKTVLDLWNDKCGFSSECYINRAMQHGIDNEERARDWINEDEGLNLIPMCVENDLHPFFKASFDGYDAEKRILTEIKCPVNEKILDDVLNGNSAPKYWYDQIQWQMTLCNPHRSFISVWDHRHQLCTKIETFAMPTLQEEMKEKAHAFWTMVKTGQPPAPEAKDYIDVDNPELRDLLSEYRDHSLVINSATERKKQLRQKIIEYGDDGNFSCNGYSITRCMPVKKYDMEKMRGYD